MIVERLYRGEGIAPNTRPDKIRQIRLLLLQRLATELDKTHVWLAACTVAVMAGEWTGRRLRKRRLKLLKLINECSLALEEAVLELPAGWEGIGIYDGYGAHHKFSKDTGISTDRSVLLGMLNAGYFKEA